MRWIWRYRDYSARENFGPLKRLALPLFLEALKRWDKHAARQPDQFVANSNVVAERIWDVYKRQAVVIPPPIAVNRFKLSRTHNDYYLILSRLVSYKRIDLAIEACRLLNRRLIIVGDGTDRARLQSLSGPETHFVGRVSDRDVEAYVAGCRALLFPGEEDFGMAPLEVAAAGKPTIALKAGGALETIIEGTTGIFFDEPTAAALAGAMEDFEHMLWSPERIREHARRFDVSVFQSRFSDLLHSMGAPLEKSLPAEEVSAA